MNKERAREQIKEKLLEKFKEHCYPVTQKDNSIEDGMTLTGITQVLNEVFSNIDSLDNGWVDVRDRLPKDRDYYLVCGKEKHEIGFACYNQDLGVWYLSPDDMHYGDYEIIAWKPLPKPYERKE